MPQTDKNSTTADSSSKFVPIIAFTSGKGGCGKTTLSANFANIIAKAHNKVLLIDLDISNRGTTGLFSKWTHDVHDKLTLTRLLKGDIKSGNEYRQLINVKEGYYIIPASSSDEETWKEPKNVKLEEFVEGFRLKLLDIIKNFDIQCVVLDCFCGIDLLTTTGAAVADDTLIVNEPDVITFTGSLNLLKHLENSFSELQKKPKIHFVINRLKSNTTVTQLINIYENNLEKELNEAILCHFPYHEKIFENFGKYPFISDLIPGSLFDRKLELLTYLLFKGSNDNLIKPKVQRWSKRRIKSVYLKSIDSSSVDSDFLVSKLTGFPLLGGFWFIVSFLFLRSFPLSPYQGWGIILVIVATIALIVFTSLIYGLWLASRFNFSLAKYYFLHSKYLPVRIKKIQRILSSISTFIKGSLMTITLLALGSIIVFLVGTLLLYMFNMDKNPDKDLISRIVNTAKIAPIRILNLNNSRISDIDFLYNKFTNTNSIGSKTSFFNFHKPILKAKNTKFIKCIFSTGVFEDANWEGCNFDSCMFNTVYYSDTIYWGKSSTLLINNTTWNGVHFSNEKKDDNLSNENWSNSLLSNKFIHHVIFFNKSNLQNVEIKIKEGCGIYFRDCRLSDVKLINIDNQKPCMYTITGNTKERIDSLSGKWIVEADSMKFNPNLEYIQDQINYWKFYMKEFKTTYDYRVSRLNLSELYIISNQHNNLSKVDSLLKIPLDTVYAQINGYRYMLKVLYDISADDAGISDDLNDWKNWLTYNRNNPNWNWEWDTWNENLPWWQYTNDQMKKFNAIQASARQYMNINELDDIFSTGSQKKESNIIDKKVKMKKLKYYLRNYDKTRIKKQPGY